LRRGENTRVPKRAVRTYLFADLRDYTPFVETRGDTAATRLLRAYRSIVRAEVRARRGAEIKTEGDSFYVVFNAPGDAVRCALGIARRAKTHNERHADLPLRIAIGINTGEAVEHDHAYVGSAVNLAARLTQQAEAGRILVTDTLRSLVRTGGLAPMRDLGAYKLKGVAEPVHVYEVETTRASPMRALGPAMRLPALLLPPALRGGTGLVVCPELVQRETKLAALLEHVGAAATGESRLVTLTGEAGVGKSRLARELARVAYEDGFYVFGGRSHATAADPYEPFIAALRPYAQARGTEILKRLLGTLTSELRRLLPEIDIGYAPDDVTIPSEERRDRFFRTIHLLLEDAASLRPVLLVLEDFHEADAASRDLLRYLAAALHGGICIVFTYREEELGPTDPVRALVAELEGERSLFRVALKPLDAAGVARMTRALLPGRATDELARAVMERSEGVPFYVEELLKTAIDDPDARPDRLPLPRTVRDSVQMRLARLADERGRSVTDLLEAVAIASIPLGYEALVGVSGRAEHEAADDLSAAVEAQLLERATTQREIYQFRHALTRDAIESAIPLSRRRGLHLRVAEALERVAKGPKAAPSLAHHFAAAGEKTRAIRYARLGASSAIALGAYASAIDLLREAAANSIGVAEEADVLEELGGALQAAGRAAEAEDILVQARELVRDDARRARIDLRLAAVLRMEGQRGPALAAVKRVISVLERGGGPLLAEALARQADLAWAENDTNQTAQLAQEALRSARSSGARAVEVEALTLHGAALARLGHQAGIDSLESAIRLGSELGLSGETVNAHLELARAHLFRGRNEDALAAAQAGLAIARKAGLEFAQSRILSMATTMAVNLGRYSEARAFAEQAVALARPDTIAGNFARVALAHVMSDQGEGEAALALLDSVRAEAERNEPDRRMIYWSYRAQALLGLRRLEEAWESAVKAVDLTTATPGMGMTAFLNAAEIAEARRDLAAIEHLSARCEDYFAGRDTAPIRILRLEVAAIREYCRRADAAASFDVVADAYQALGAQVRTVYRRATAEVLRATASSGRRGTKLRLDAFRKQLIAFGALRYVRAIDAALRRRGPGRAETRGPLSEREQRIAVLVSRGFTDRRIAHELGVSAQRASELVRSVLDHLGVSTRSQVAAWVVDRERVGAGATGLVP
jgi:class 3 adenylate cyclase/predicted ATPase/DNA-binding NarL/FixJ family response regulator